MENSFETTNDLPIHQKIYQKLDYYLVSNKIPHIIFHGSSGSGSGNNVNPYNGDLMRYLLRPIA
jgi:hypothetical protein